MSALDKVKNWLGFGSSVIGGNPAIHVSDPSQTSDGFITPVEALQVSAVYGCVQVIARHVGQVPCHLYQRTEDGGKEIAPDGHYYLAHLLRKSDAGITPLDFKTAIATNLALCGNGYAQILKSSSGNVVGLVPIAFYDITVNKERTYSHHNQEDGQQYRVEYFIDNYGALPQDEVLHFKNINFDGVLGLDTTSVAAKIIRLAINLERNSNAFFSNSSRPSGLLEFESNISQSAQDNWKEKFETRFKGVENSHKMGILPVGVKFNPISIDNQKAQMVETIDNATLQISRFYGVPPHLLNIQNAEPRANIVESNNSFISTTIQYYCSIIEDTLNEMLISKEDQDRFFFQMDISKLVQGNLKDKADAYSKLADKGVITVNEMRKQFGFEPLKGDQGDGEQLISTTDSNSSNEPNRDD